METDPLQQLRDIHLPTEPSWWPPAIGWWILAVLFCLASYWLARKILRVWQDRAPIRAARAHYQQLHDALQRKNIDATTYCHRCNELLKRLLVHGLGYTHLSAEFDDRWLMALDASIGDQSFSQGAGKILGNARFQQDPTLDVSGLHEVMSKLLQRIKP